MSGRVEWMSWPVVVHSVRTSVAAVATLLAARLFELSEAYPAEDELRQRVTAAQWTPGYTSFVSQVGDPSTIMRVEGREELVNLRVL